MQISDMQAGKAGEYLVCADLILHGYVAFPSEQGLSYDVVTDVNGRLVRIQVKATRQPVDVPQRVSRVPGYLFHVRRMGKGGRRHYEQGDVDMFALVALDTRTIGYVSVARARTTMLFRVPALQGKYRGESQFERKAEILRLRGEGLSYRKIAAVLSVDSSYAHRVATGREVATVKGAYLHEFTFSAALETLSI